MFSVASNFDDELPGRVAGMEVDELFGSCDDAPVGHGRPRAMIPPTTWRTLERHVKRCRTAELGFCAVAEADNEHFDGKTTE